MEINKDMDSKDTTITKENKILFSTNLDNTKKIIIQEEGKIKVDDIGRIIW